MNLFGNQSMPNESDTADVSGGKNNEQKDGEGDFPKYFSKSGVWTAIFTGILTIFTGLLWSVNRTANDTSIAAQRAIISWNGPFFQNDVDGKTLKGIKADYAAANSGTTPGSKAVAEWNVYSGPYAPQEGLDFDSLTQSERRPYILGPKGNFQVLPIDISNADLEAAAAGKKHLFLWGWTTYHDIFSNIVHLSEFCTEVTQITWSKPDHIHFDPKLQINLIYPPCPVHNCYDKDCADYNKRVQ
jgi:hypothetical protein